MRWDLHFNLVVSHGRKRIFSLERLLPFLARIRERHKKFAWSCYRKTRFTSSESAMNAGWFKKHPCHHYAYACEVCDGWHLATIKDGKDEREEVLGDGNAGQSN